MSLSRMACSFTSFGGDFHDPGSFTKLNWAVFITRLISVLFPHLFVSGSANIWEPGTQYVLTFKSRAEMQITATSICALRHWPAFPDRLLSKSNKLWHQSHGLQSRGP